MNYVNKDPAVSMEIRMNDVRSQVTLRKFITFNEASSMTYLMASSSF